MRFAAAAFLAILAPPVSAAPPIEITLSDYAFEPAEITVPAGHSFTLLVHNKSAAAAEVESADLKFEKVVAAGADILLNVRAQSAGTYLFFNEYKEDVVFGHVTAQ